MWPDIWRFTKIRRSGKRLFAANPKYPATAKDIAIAVFLRGPSRNTQILIPMVA